MTRQARAMLRGELAPRQLLTSLNAALVLYLFEVIFVLSFSALVFSGGLSAFLPVALGSLLLGAALMVAITSTLGSYGGTMAIVQDAPSVVLGLAVVAMAASGLADDEGAAIATTLVLVAGTTLAFGLACLLLGTFRLGDLVRFLPYPVLGGFLAGTGWWLVIGGLRVAVDPSQEAGLLDPSAVAHWALAALIGVAAFVAVRRWPGPLTLPAICVVAIVAFYAAALATGASPDDLGADGWLLGPFPDDLGLTLPWDPAVLSSVDWPMLGSAVPLALPAVLLGAMGLLLNSSSLELVIRRELHLDRELVVTGSANLASGALGGLPGYTGISASMLGHGLGRGRRLPGVIVAVLILATVVVGLAVLALVPRMLLGGLLVYVGIALLHQWLVESRATLARADYLVVLIVLVVIALTDLLWGVVVGLFLTIALFVIDYSRVSLVRFEVTGRDLRSRVKRSPSQADALRHQGDALLILVLQDYIFFGTAHRLVELVRARLKTAEETAGTASVRVVLLDFEHVTGLDSTALLGFSKLLQELRQRSVELVLTGLRANLAQQLEAGGITDGLEAVHILSDLDGGAEWAEEHLLGDAGPEPAASLAAELALLLPGETRLGEILSRMLRLELAAGESVVRQGDAADALYLIESGQLTAWLERPDREPLRLLTMRAGGLVGEIGFFLGELRSATVTADQPSVVRVLTRAEWESLLVSDPPLAGLVHRLTIAELGHRIVDLDRALETLLR